MIKRHTLTLACLIIGLLGLSATAQKNDDMAENTGNGDVTVEMKTTMGDIKLLLYGDTPKHLENFVKLVNEGFYDGVLFHRVINDFMVQTGDPDSKNAEPGKMLGNGDPNYRIEAEFVYPRHYHKRGALAAARQGDATNPNKESSGSQFYIVTGKVFTDGQLDALEQQRILKQKKDIFTKLANQYKDSIMSMRRNRDQAGLQALQDELAQRTERQVAANPDRFTAEQRETYTTAGGTPHLDGSYTVFGEVISGMSVVDKIQKVETDTNDRPVEDVKVISMKVIRP